MQAAFGRLPAHGFPVGQLAREVIEIHPLAPTAQVATDVVDSQTVPAPAQTAGAVGQVQAAEGKEPAQALPAGHTVTESS